jgi:hypothetical protein
VKSEKMTSQQATAVPSEVMSPVLSAGAEEALQMMIGMGFPSQRASSALLVAQSSCGIQIPARGDSSLLLEVSMQWLLARAEMSDSELQQAVESTITATRSQTNANSLTMQSSQSQYKMVLVVRQVAAY